MQRYMRTLQQGYTWNSVDRDRLKIIGRGTWKMCRQRYMGKGYVEVHGKIIGRGTWENYRQRYMGKSQVEVHGKSYRIATCENIFIILGKM